MPDGALPFVKGLDLSMLKYILDRGGVYREAGQPKDPIALVLAHGVNYARLRLFVAPDGTDGQVNSLPYTLALAKQVKQGGLRFLLDLHYSDSWADPGHQPIPRAWARLSGPALTQRVFEYTRDTVAAFGRAGCLPDMVQVGNEITNGMMWPAGGPFHDASKWNDLASRTPLPGHIIADSGDKWDALTNLLKAGVRGVHAADPAGGIRIMIHIDKGGNAIIGRWFFDNLRQRGVEFDVIGLSYYPFWHGTLPDLRNNINLLARDFDRDIIVAETGYDWNGGKQGALPTPLTPDGQAAFLEQLLHTVATSGNGRGKGVIYWAPEWIEGAKWNGPSWSKTWENRALFDTSGDMLPAMRAFERY